jgi:DNA mismatch repair ATPase MutL
VLLSIETKQEEVDVNITPDKRQILFENEKFLLATVRWIISYKYK